MATDERPMYFLVGQGSPARSNPQGAVAVVECPHCYALIREQVLTNHVEAAHPDSGEG